MVTVPHEVISSGARSIAIYLDSIAKGTVPRMAEMFALQSPPRAMTDAVMFEGIGSLSKQYDGEDVYLKEIISASRAHGHEPGKNDMYMENLARFKGDPEAFVPPTGGRGHIQKVCESRGIPCDGSVKVKGRDPAPPKKVRLGGDMVDQIESRMVKDNPDLKHVDRSELRSGIIEKHGSKK